jgi:hypothetical protein
MKRKFFCVGKAYLLPPLLPSEEKKEAAPNLPGSFNCLCLYVLGAMFLLFVMISCSPLDSYLSFSHGLLVLLMQHMSKHTAISSCYNERLTPVWMKI